MRSVIKNIKYCFFLLLLFCASCKHDNLNVYVESENYRNASDFLANNYDLSLFHAALQQAGMLEELKGVGPYTLFAPNNKAFNDLGIVRASDFAKMNADSLRFMLQYHILPRRLYRDDVPRNTIDNKFLNLAGKPLFLGYKYNNSCTSCLIQTDIYVNGALAPKATQNAVLGNGVLHVLDKVLKYSPTVQQALESRADLSIFVIALKHFGQWESLAGSALHTVFAPDNQSFIAAGITPEQILAMNPAKYAKRLWGTYLIENHVFISDMKIYGQMPGSGYYGAPFYKAKIVGDEAFSFGVGADPEMSPFIVRTDAADPNITLRRVAMRPGYQMDHKAENGVVHSIRGLLVLPAEALIN